MNDHQHERIARYRLVFRIIDIVVLGPEFNYQN